MTRSWTSVTLLPAEAPSLSGAAERIRLAYADGSTDEFRLQDYDRIYAVPGLYDEVVHNRLRCASPWLVSCLLCGAALSEGVSTSSLRVLDLAAGNGRVGEWLRRIGVDYIVGFDNIDEARAAAFSERPGLYDEYLVGDIRDTDCLGDVIGRHRLNTITCAGAMGHLPFDDFQQLWALFPAGSWLSTSFYDAAGPEPDPVNDDTSRVAAYFRDEIAAERFTLIGSVRFRHRFAMNGEAVPGAGLVGRRAAWA